MSSQSPILAASSRKATKRVGEDAEVVNLRSENEELKQMVKKMSEVIMIMSGKICAPVPPEEEEMTSMGSVNVVNEGDDLL